MKDTTHTKQMTQAARQEVRGGRRPDEPCDRKRSRPRARVSAGQPAGAAGVVPVVLLAGLDWLTLTSRTRVSEDIYARLAEAKAAARLEEREGRVYCPSWPDAQLRPTGAKGYPFLVETEDFTIKVAGEHQRTWPGLAIELRSHFLHTHPAGLRNACEEALGWVRSQLLYDQHEAMRQEVAWERVNVSRADLHIDWQGGFVPTFAAGEERCFIRPRGLLWHPYIVGTTCQGYRFGSGDPLMARIYNKTAECRRRHDESYAALLAARNGERFDVSHDVWRLEFELKREALASLKLAAALDTEDLAADIEAELSAEELPRRRSVLMVSDRMNSGQRRMGVEPTHDGARPPCNSFEDRCSRSPSSSGVYWRGEIRAFRSSPSASVHQGFSLDVVRMLYGGYRDCEGA